MKQQTIHLLVVDDNTNVRKAIRALLEFVDQIEIIGEACDGQEAIRLAKELNPHVILMDLMMPEKDGVDAIRRISAQNPEILIVIMTSFAPAEKLFLALASGAHNYLPKNAAPEELILIIQQTYQGEANLHGIVYKELYEAFANEHHDCSLTSCEEEILKLLIQRFTIAQAADQLKMHEKELRKSLSRIIAKLHNLHLE